MYCSSVYVSLALPLHSLLTSISCLRFAFYFSTSIITSISFSQSSSSLYLFPNSSSLSSSSLHSSYSLVSSTASSSPPSLCIKSCLLYRPVVLFLSIKSLHSFSALTIIYKNYDLGIVHISFIV